MDIEHPQETSDDEAPTPGVLVRAKDVLPGAIPILPQAQRPFFPGQAIPLLVDPALWEETIRAAEENANNVIGLLLVDTSRAEQAKLSSFFKMGTACRIHRIGMQDGRMQVLLEGLQRFQVSEWLNTRPPFTARVRYFPEERYAEVPEIRAYAIAVINAI